MNDKRINILLCFDDKDWNYTRHAAVTILSLLETNKNNKIKIWIMSSSLPQENIAELKRIIDLYNQEVEFIIRNDIIPENLKKFIINKRALTWGVRYRRFFPKFIKWIDRILCIDCDVLIMKDISEIYNMDMHWRAIACWNDIEPNNTQQKKHLWLDKYFNAWVLLFDAEKYNVNKINTKTLKEINSKYSNYFWGCDQDKANIIFKDDIFIYKQWMNYIVVRPFYNDWIENAEIIHCIAKPYIENSNAPKKLCKLYDFYLDKTKWKWFPKIKRKVPIIWYLNINFHRVIFIFLSNIFWRKVAAKYWEIQTRFSDFILSIIKI